MLIILWPAILHALLPMMSTADKLPLITTQVEWWNRITKCLLRLGQLIVIVISLSEGELKYGWNFTWKKARKNFEGTKARKANWACWWVSLIFLALAFYALYTLAAKTNRKAAWKVLIRKKEKRLSPDTFSQVCHSFLQLPTMIFDSVPDTPKYHKTTSNAGYYWIFARYWS